MKHRVDARVHQRARDRRAGEIAADRLDAPVSARRQRLVERDNAFDILARGKRLEQRGPDEAGSASDQHLQAQAVRVGLRSSRMSCIRMPTSFRMRGCGSR